MQNGLLSQGSGMNNHGIAAYAFYIGMVPRTEAQKPSVVFDVEDSWVEQQRNRMPAKLAFAFMVMRDPTTKIISQMKQYVPITIVGFMNVFNPLLRVYNGPIGIV